MKEVTVIFDIGKTNKKILLFDNKFNIIRNTEVRFNTVLDDDGFECDDIERIEQWIITSLREIVSDSQYQVQAVNFATYGASLIYLDKKGKRLTPLYNYLKPIPEGFFDEFYARYGGVEEFSRITASPAMGMLNSGLQILWLKMNKPDVFRKVEHILHFPNYLSYILTKKCLSEYTSIGCHTAMWDFDNMQYHSWLTDEEIKLEQPVPNDFLQDITIYNKQLKVGTGIHDSSSSLVPYVYGSNENFILISTGTWCITMNPFNDEPLTNEQLKRECTSYLSIDRKPVKSSQLFMGKIHDLNLKRINDHFGTPEDRYKKVFLDMKLLRNRLQSGNGTRRFFIHLEEGEYLDNSVDLAGFHSFDEAYHHLIFDLTELCIEAIDLVIGNSEEIQNYFVTGGFARNEIFMRYLATRCSDKSIFLSEIDNATALGAALTILPDARYLDKKKISIQSKKIM